MNTRLALLRLHCPPSVRHEALRALSEATAAALCRAAPQPSGGRFEDRLAAYATFTAGAIDGALARGADPDVLAERLRERAHHLGRRLRGRLRVHGIRDVMDAGRLLYGIIGIDFRGDRQGRIVIERCAFSRYYSPAVCRVAAGLDEGVMTGIAGGGRLTFSQRITEGHDRCLACLTAPHSA
jgi:hypothetical protein